MYTDPKTTRVYGAGHGYMRIVSMDEQSTYNADVPTR